MAGQQLTTPYVLPPRAIAKRLDTPVETVKTRIKRGLAHLKRELEDNNDSDHLVRGLGLVACGPGLGGRAGLLTNLGVHGLKVAGKWKLALLVAGSVGFFVLWPWGQDSSSPDLPEALVVAEENALPAGERNGSQETADSSGERSGVVLQNPTTQTPTAIGGQLVGTLRLSASGAPLALVPIDLEFAGGTRERVVCDAQGHFEYAIEEPCRLIGALISSTEQTPARFVVQGLDLVPGKVTVAEWVVGLGASLSGRVLDSSDQPQPGAIVQAWCEPLAAQNLDRDPDRQVTADAAGRFTLAHVGEWVHAEAHTASGKAISAIRGVLSQGQVIEDVVLRVSDLVDNTLRISDPDGLPVAGAEITLEVSEPPLGERATAWEDVYRVKPKQAALRGTSKLDGTYTFIGLPRAPYSVRVRHPDFLEWNGVVQAVDAGEEMLVSLKRANGLSGRILGPAGHPVANAAVCLHTQAGIACTKSDSDGRFRIKEQEPTWWSWLSVEAQGYAVFIMKPEMNGAGSNRNLLLQLEQEQRIGGFVVDPSGAPLTNVLVEVSGDRLLQEVGDRPLDRAPSWEVLLGRADTRTDEAGAFEFEALYEGNFELAVRFFDGSQRAQFFEARSGEQALKLVVDPGRVQDVVFEGQVTNAVTGSAVERFTVLAMGRSPEGWTFNSKSIEFDSSDGRYAIGGLPAQELMLFVSAHGYRDGATASELRGSGRFHLDVKLVPARHLSLRLIDQNGQPVPGYLSVNDSGGKLLWLPFGGGSSGSIAVGSAGEATLQNLPAAEIVVSFSPSAHRTWPAGSQLSWSFPFDLSEPLIGIQKLLIEVPD